MNHVTSHSIALAEAHRLGMLRGAGFVGFLLLCQTVTVAGYLFHLGIL